ncbi:LIC11966 family surface protein [Chitinophaga arvensicola]|uniref:Lipoprotein n=1 Tax=Chitinophaga arvensicola TaxID=29529 RepID=A0A1I0S7N4_9BACT|nr:hypothetical protein [Chitinophaga arvensicola]SEW51818.1 hypothetical protein SAMN04488122_4518 [Chitinophaga arvensicola]
MKQVKALLAGCCAAVVFASCGSTSNPVEYNNKLMTVINDNEKNINAMNTAMAGQDYKKAETTRKTWVAQLDKSIGEVDKMDAIKEDDGLKASVLQGLKDYRKIAAEEFPKLIDLRTREKNGDAGVQPDIQAALDKINHAYESIAGNVNKAATSFEKKNSK